MDQAIMNKIKQCVEAALERSVDNLEPSMSLSDDLEMESLQMVLFQVELEDTFGISFDPIEDDFFEIFSTIGSVYLYVKKAKTKTDDYRYVNPVLRQVTKKIYDNRTDYPCNYCDARIESIEDQDFALLSFVSRGCSHDIKGGCTMCNYAYRKARLFDNEMVLNGIRECVRQLPRHLHELVIEPTGSFLDNEEIPHEVFMEVLHILSQLECDEFICETRADTVTREKLKHLSSIRCSKKTLEIGVESTDLWILRNCINKNSSLDEVKNAIDIAHSEGVDICANVGIGFPFVNEKVNISSAVDSIQNMLKSDVSCVLFVYNIRPGTLLEWLWRRGLYDCTSLWALVEVLSNFTDEELRRIQIAWYRNYYLDKSRILKMPYLCEDCQEHVLKLLDDYRNYPCRSTLQPLLDYDCHCKRNWYAQYQMQADQIEFSNVDRIYRIMAEEFHISDDLLQKELQYMLSDLSRKE